MHFFDDEDISQLLRLKRYEQPPPDYFTDFLSEFRRRQRDELRHQPLWSVCLDRAQDVVSQHNIRPLVSYPAGVAVVVACAVISIRFYQQPEPVQVAVESSPVPSTPAVYAEPPMMVPTFNVEPTFLPGSRDVPMLPLDRAGSDQFVPLELEWESLEDRSLREK